MTDTLDAPPTPPEEDLPPADAHVLGGVAALIGDRLGVDPFWLRMSFVVTTLTGGVGVLAYLALWLLLVAGPRWRSVLLRAAGGALFVIGVPLMLADATGDVIDDRAAVIVLLAGLAVALWQPRRPRPARVPLLPPAGPAVPPLAPPPPPPIVAVPRPAPRPPSVLGRAALGLAVVVSAAGALVDQANGGRLHPEQWLGAGAAVCAIGLLVGTVRGRARWLVLPAAALAAAGYGGGVIARVGVSVDEHGDRWVDVAGAGFTNATARTAFGTVHVTVSAAPAQQAVIDARSAFGGVEVWADPSVTVEVRSDIDHGALRSGGVTLDVDAPDARTTVGPPGTPDVVVLARVGHGDVEVGTYEMATPFEPLRPPVAGVVLGPEGFLHLGNDDAVLSPEGVVVRGSVVAEGSGATVISTGLGEYRVEPWGELVDPYGNAMPLDEVVEQLASAGTLPLSQTTAPRISATTTTSARLPTTTETMP
jgi:phage shock protein PspC (stress-responsive transcriptional regulator)